MGWSEEDERIEQAILTRIKAATESRDAEIARLKAEVARLTEEVFAWMAIANRSKA